MSVQHGRSPDHQVGSTGRTLVGDMGALLTEVQMPFIHRNLAMATWSKDELSKIAEGDDLYISPFRDDGKTYGTPTWIWSVVVDDALYVRTTDRGLVGTKLLCGRRRGGSWPLA